MIDLLALAVLAGAGWMGWRRGTLLMVIAACGLIVSSLVALVLYRPIGALIVGVFHMSQPIALILGGFIAMFATSVAQRIVVRRIARGRASRRAEGWKPSVADSAGGAAFGVLWIGGLGLIVVWAVMSLASLAGSGASIERSFTGRLTSAFAERVTYAVVKRAVGDPFVATFIARVGARPGAASTAMRAVLGDPRLQHVWSNPVLRRAIAARDLHALEQDADIQSLADDDRFRRAAQVIGLVGTQPGVDALAQDLIVNVGPLARALESLQQDPAAKRLLEDPGLVDAAKDGNSAALITSPAFSALGSKFVDILKANAAAGR